MLLGPGCCCVTVDCIIGTDDFSDTADPPSGWTEVSGSDWADNSTYLSTATSNAVLKFNTAHPDAISCGIVEVDCYGANGDELRVLLDYTDSSNYRFAQLTIGDPNGCLALYERVAGSNTLLSKIRVEASASTYHTLKIYFGDGQFAAKFNGVSTIYMHRPESGTGTYCGLGTGTIASTVRFDNFTFTKHKNADVAGSESCPEYIEHCGLLTDTFARANSTDLGCAWYESAGSWAIASTAYLETASSNGVCYTEVRHPEAALTGVATMSVNAGSMVAGDEVVLYVSFSDSTNTMKAVFKLADAGGAGGSCKLYAAGVQVGSTLTLTTFKEGSAGPHSFSLCFNNQILTANTPDGDVSADTSVDGYGDRAGVGTGTITGTVDIDEFTFSKHRHNDDGCPACSHPCGLLCTDAVPEYWKIEWSGIVDSNGDCTDCFDLDSGIVYVPWYNYVSGTPTCNWQRGCLPDTLMLSCLDGLTDPVICQFFGQGCPDDSIEVFWTVTILKRAGHYILQVTFQNGCEKSGDPDATMVFEYDFGTSMPDCADTTPRSCTWISTTYETATGGGFTQTCNFLNSGTVTATAVP